ncbi:hypothetical protein TREMEDRAFT_63442 [Tremella mesenterica DSM 1558]|uniref:uncharacterized protein n=1 Tax=Tremella mesenterica (strain ATCC 24925 / CBS 8224 / DSM 1558 / NBRC 9311 / NRRL Y-6157 / RJB 2259-6 / UBC 559-6) TaxID=578456 RepID=UPI0003F49D90|nr:uncharacterized protein TREMEDRAFT_63442 [Tremella mesenterica DSM 1558]EIW68272.1 hypothetical protein TREMEDRAFT_63442 [Tremella mesenterica DSM 1558]
MSITEIGSSAFQLQTVLEQRRDVLDGKTRIRRMDEEEEEEGEDGRLPVYPRGMLKLELSDGRGVMKGLEYRRLGGLVLGETALGSKLLLHNARMLFDKKKVLLTPENCTILGYSVDHLEAEQPRQFVRSLMRRMGKPVSSDQIGQTPQQQHQPQELNSSPELIHTAPLISKPSRNNAHTSTSAQRTTKIPKQTTRPNPTSVVPPSRRQNTTHELPSTPGPSRSNQRPSRSAGTQASAKLKRLYDDYPEAIPIDSSDDEMSKFGNTKLPKRDKREIRVVEDEFSDEVDESFIRQITEAEAFARAGRRGVEASSDYGEMDDILWRAADEVEASLERRWDAEEERWDDGVEREGSGKENIPIVIEISD